MQTELHLHAQEKYNEWPLKEMYSLKYGSHGLTQVTESTVKSHVTGLLNLLAARTKDYRTNHYMLQIGDDFSIYNEISY